MKKEMYKKENGKFFFLLSSATWWSLIELIDVKGQKKKRHMLSEKERRAVEMLFFSFFDMLFNKALMIL